MTDPQKPRLGEMIWRSIVGAIEKQRSEAQTRLTAPLLAGD